MDVVYLAALAALFGLVVAFAKGCARLTGGRMSLLTILAGLAAAGLLIYLIAALLFPEDFS
jgi:K+-transporting ATPase KdpF subunit